MKNKTHSFLSFCPFASFAVLLCLIVTIMRASKVCAQQASFSTQPPKHELRAVWLTTVRGLDWPKTQAVSEETRLLQQRELTDILDKLQRANINTILLQARVRATAIFPSEYEPWAECLSGTGGVSPGYDALQFAIDECHKRGMELHAWLVTLPIGKWDDVGCQTIRKSHPNMVRKIGTLGFLNPEQEETADYLATICREITRKYDIDGIHLDYMRYPDEWNTKINRVQGRKNITRIVKAISNAVKAEKPWVKMSCSPVGKYSDLTRYSSKGWNARDKVCQDAQGWLRDGLMDQLYPMMYFKDNHFYPFAIDWQENTYGRSVSAGLGIYFLDPREGRWVLSDVTREMHVLRQLGLGHTYFRSQFFTKNMKDLYDYVCSFIDNYPALVPPMTWVNNSKPEKPADVRCQQRGGMQRLEWDGNTPYYNIYCSKTYPVNTEDVRNLIAQRVSNHYLNIPTSQAYYYAVTGMDRYGNESSPMQSHDFTPYESRLLDNDGTIVQLPDLHKIIDAKFVTIETLQGSIITTRPYMSSVSINDVAEGMYIVRTLNKKGVSHKLGYMKIDRRYQEPSNK